MDKVFNIIVRGRVQRVGYRSWALSMANRLNICGWVKNLPNGNVELMVKGSEEQINQVIQECQKGPFSARVDGLVVNEIYDSQLYEIEGNFRIL